MATPVTAPSVGHGPSSTDSRSNYVATAIVLVIVAVFTSVVWVWNRTAEQRAIRHLPAEERRALFDRTLRTLKDPCGAGKPTNGLETFCREQAEFILQFPECDAACTALARGHLTTPSR